MTNEPLLLLSEAAELLHVSEDHRQALPVLAMFLPKRPAGDGCSSGHGQKRTESVIRPEIGHDVSRFGHRSLWCPVWCHHLT